ncbi:hypothetical protein D3C87_1349440 [compost metagenome]
MRYNVGNQAFVVLLILPHYNHTLFYTIAFPQNVFNFGNFNPIAPYFYLIINSSLEFNVSICLLPGKIACFVQPCP